MIRPNKNLLFPLTLLSSLAFADGPAGLSAYEDDWQLACDNTRTCKVAGYQRDEQTQRVSVLLTRKAGPNQPVSGQVQIGHYDDSEVLDSLPEVFNLTLRINGQPVGQITLSKSSWIADLNPSQVTALLAALARSSRVEFTTGHHSWLLSEQGAAAVLLKMDEFQGRLDTPGALIQKGPRDEGSVLAPVPVPVVMAAALAKPRPEDRHFVKTYIKALSDAIRTSSINNDDCLMVRESQGNIADLAAVRLTDTKMLVSAQCWMAAFNTEYGFWIINATPPYQPRLLTAIASELLDLDAPSVNIGRIIRPYPLGSGRTDCWDKEEWTWDGQAFVLTTVISGGMCKSIAMGGGWTLPTLITEVREPPRHTSAIVPTPWRKPEV
ncbi:MAG: DUF1176 domain-containing protein [Shewanella oncorhynchi]